MPAAAPWIALIRTIGGATHAKMSMAAPRAAAADAGLAEPRTLLATGNLLFRSRAPEADLAGILRRILAAHGLENEVFLRFPASIEATRAANPFPRAARERPHHLLVVFMSAAGAAPAGADAARWDGPERIAVVGREAFVNYPDGAGRSKLTAGRLERMLGRTGTARNWNTVGPLAMAWN